LPLYGQATHASWRPDPSRGLFAVKYDYRVGKVSLDTSAGWFAAVNGQTDHCFIGKFKWFPAAPYPDNASLEFWLNGAGEFVLNGTTFTNAPDLKATPYLMETEILSPLVELEPAQEYPFQIDWFATRCPTPIIDVTSAGAVHERLSVSVKADRARLRGTFGVFNRGRAEATIFDALGNVVGRHDLGAVDPNQVLRVGTDLVLPKGAGRISLAILDDEGQNRGWLGNVSLLP